MHFYIFKKIPSVCVRGFKYMEKQKYRNLYTSAKLMVKLKILAEMNFCLRTTSTRHF